MLIPFESLSLAKETTPGTAIAAPTHHTRLNGATLKLAHDIEEPQESDGTLAMSGEGRQRITREWGEFSGDSALDTNFFPMVLQASVKGGSITPSTPSGATNSRLWEYVPTLSADNIDFLTMFFGDPNMSNFLRGAYGMVKNWSVGGNASGGEGVKFSLGGMTAKPTKVAVPTLPAQSPSGLLSAMNTDVWLDSGVDAIGTTSITSIASQTEVSLETNVLPLYFSVGADGTLTYTQHGRIKRQLVLTTTVDFSNFDNWDLLAAGTVLKLRVRYSGAEIESGFRHYAEFDGYGLGRFDDYGELEGARRLIKFTVKTAIDSTLGSDFRVAVQNAKASL